MSTVAREKDLSAELVAAYLELELELSAALRENPAGGDKVSVLKQRFDSAADRLRERLTQPGVV